MISIASNILDDDSFHHISPKYLDRYVQELAGRNNVYDLDTIDQVKAIGVGMRGKQLRYKDLIATNCLASGARS